MTEVGRFGTVRSRLIERQPAVINLYLVALRNELGVHARFTARIFDCLSTYAARLKIIAHERAR